MYALFVCYLFFKFTVASFVEEIPHPVDSRITLPGAANVKQVLKVFFIFICGYWLVARLVCRKCGGALCRQAKLRKNL